MKKLGMALALGAAAVLVAAEGVVIVLCGIKYLGGA